MGPPVGLIVELIRKPELVRLFPDHVVDKFNGPVRSQVGRRKFQIGSHGPKNLLPLLTDRLRHDQKETISFDCRDERQSYPCVPTGRLKNNLLFSQFPASLSCFNHVKSRSVLHRPSWVKGFQLCQDLHVFVGVESCNGNQRRPSYLVQYIPQFSRHALISK